MVGGEEEPTLRVAAYFQNSHSGNGGSVCRGGNGDRWIPSMAGLERTFTEWPALADSCLTALDQEFR